MDYQIPCYKVLYTNQHQRLQTFAYPEELTDQSCQSAVNATLNTTKEVASVDETTSFIYPRAGADTLIVKTRVRAGYHFLKSNNNANSCIKALDNIFPVHVGKIRPFEESITMVPY